MHDVIDRPSAGLDMMMVKVRVGTHCYVLRLAHLWPDNYVSMCMLRINRLVELLLCSVLSDTSPLIRQYRAISGPYRITKFVIGCRGDTNWWAHDEIA